MAAAPTSPDTVLARLRDAQDRLSPQFQAAARYLLAHPEEIALSSMRQLAAQAGVQPATLVRLAQSLGLDGWQALRACFTETLRRQSAPYSAPARRLTRQADAPLLAAIAQAQARNLAALNGQDQAYTQAAHLLTRADHVHVAGFRAAFPIAFGLHYPYRLFRPGVTLLRAEAGTLDQELRAFGPRDAVFAVSFAPYSHEIVQVAQAARAAGCRLIALTDGPGSPLAPLADCLLALPVASPSFFPSTAAGLAAVERLLALLLAQHGAAGIAALEAAEQSLARSRAYVAGASSQGRSGKRKRES